MRDKRCTNLFLCYLFAWTLPRGNTRRCVVAAVLCNFLSPVPVFRLFLFRVALLSYVVPATLLVVLERPLYSSPVALQNSRCVL